MLKKFALLFGVVFTTVGVLGFVPGITQNGHLLGIFEVNTLHNIVHLLSGLAALAAAAVGFSRQYFQVFGVVYALVTVLGFIMDPILGLIPVNGADNVLHIVLTAALLYLGFGYRERDAAATV